MEDYPIVVIDNGGCTIKAGISGQDHPSVILPNAIGLEEFANLSDPETFKSYLDKTSQEGGSFRARHPVSEGQITNWEDMETIWSNIVDNHLPEINPEESCILVTEPIGNPKPAREKIAEILIEKLNFAGVNIATAPILPMYAAGRTTGIVLDVGDGVTQVVPVWGGYPITDAMKRVDYGGCQVTQLLAKEHKNQHTFANSKTPPEVFRRLKEKTCHVVLDYNASHQSLSSSSSEFQLPNGDKVQVGSEAISSPEYLFNPSQFSERKDDANSVGVHQLVYKSIMKTNIDVRKDLYANIVLSGGSTLFPGFAERLEKELKELVPPSVKIQIVSHPVRKYFTWIGGSVLASLASFPSTLVSKESWQDGSGRFAIAKLNSSS